MRIGKNGLCPTCLGIRVLDSDGRTIGELIDMWQTSGSEMDEVVNKGVYENLLKCGGCETCIKRAGVFANGASQTAQSFCPQCGRPLAPGTVCDCSRAQSPIMPSMPQRPEPYQTPEMMQYTGMPSAAYPGSTLIKVAAIIMIVLGAIGTLASLGSLGGDAAGLAAFELLMNLLVLATGICGVMFCKVPEKATLLMGGGIAVVVMKFIDLCAGMSMISDMVADLGSYAVSEAYVSGYKLGLVFGVLIGSVPPILMIIGGSKLRKK